MTTPCRFDTTGAVGDQGIHNCEIHPNGIGLDGGTCDLGLAALRAELHNTYARLEAVLLERPYKDGNYTHLPYCNTSTKNVPGTPGVTCNCRVGAALRATCEEQGRVIAGLREALELIQRKWEETYSTKLAFLVMAALVVIIGIGVSSFHAGRWYEQGGLARTWQGLANDMVNRDSQRQLTEKGRK